MATDKSTAEDVAANQPAPARSESWVVLTAWTQPEAPQEAFPGDSQQDPLQDQDSSSASGQLSHQILPARPNRPAAARPAMTPLIFTFGDPNSLFPAFAAVPTRMGWLVIQL
jgi:hypothetical protein